MYFIFMVMYANFTYIQFSLIQILSVALIFLSIIVFLGVIFLKSEITCTLELSIKNVLAAFFTIFVLIILSIILPIQILSYANPLILMETELGLGWNHDTAFNVALIQSILNFGYPSTAQNGHPILIYHALSHYIDALILRLTGLEPYDSYGLLFHFKVFLLISSTVLFISAVTRGMSATIYLVSIIFFIPLAIGNGLGIGSHSLWFSSIFMLITAPYIFSNLFKKNSNSPTFFCVLLIIIIIIALTKISSAIMLASLFTTFIFIKNPKKLVIYIFGSALIIFFYIWSSLYISNGSKVLFDYSTLGVQDLYQYYFFKELYPGAFKITPVSYTHLTLPTKRIV